MVSLEDTMVQNMTRLPTVSAPSGQLSPFSQNAVNLHDVGPNLNAGQFNQHYTLWNDDVASFQNDHYDEKAVATIHMDLTPVMYTANGTPVQKPPPSYNTRQGGLLIPYGTAVVMVDKHYNLFTGTYDELHRHQKYNKRASVLTTACYFNQKDLIPGCNNAHFFPDGINKECVVAVKILAADYMCSFDFDNTATFSIGVKGTNQVQIPSFNTPFEAKAGTSIYWRMDKYGKISYTPDPKSPSIKLGVLELNKYINDTYMSVVL